MKRAFYEWAAIFFATTSILGMAYWGVSLVSDVANFELSIGRGSFTFQMAASDGRLQFCDHFANREIIDIVDKGIALDPNPTGILSWSLPGLEIHHIRFAQSSSVWSLSVSVVILVALSVFLTMLCVRGFRRAVSQTAKLQTPPTNTAPEAKFGIHTDSPRR